MRKTISIFTLLTILLAACAQPPAAPPTAAPELPTAVSTEVLQAAPTTAPTEAAAAAMLPEPTAPAEAESSAPEGGMTVYQILPGDSQVSYEVGETFLSQNNRFAVAIGVTPQVSGEIKVDLKNPQTAQIGEIQVDISQFQSDSARRDGAIRDRFLQSSAYPIAVFKPTRIEGLPETYVEGEQISIKVIGDLTVKETTQPATFDVTVKIEGGALSGSATATILMSQFNVGPISIAGMLNTEDQVKLAFNFTAQAQ